MVVVWLVFEIFDELLLKVECNNIVVVGYIEFDIDIVVDVVVIEFVDRYMDLF